MNGKRHHWMTSSHLLAGVAGLLAAARQRSRDRAAAATLDDHDLRDLGISRSSLAFELNKPFWR